MHTNTSKFGCFSCRNAHYSCYNLSFLCVCVRMCLRDSRQWHLSRINMHMHGTGDNPHRANEVHIVNMNKARAKTTHRRHTDRQVDRQRPSLTAGSSTLLN